ncbi:hypothetical protein [Halobacillus salinarum]|nr:hypothetical protein [Halobacillus salinarum]
MFTTMLYIWNIETIIDEIVQKHNLDITYEINNKLTAPMSFNVSTNTLTFNYLQVNGYISKIKVKETEENLVKIIVFHELGYYLTFKKHKHDLKTLRYGEDDEVEALQAEIERNAWDYGRTLVPEELVNAFDRVRDQDRMLLQGL